MDARQKLHLAVTEGLLVDINKILAVSPSSINQKDTQGNTVLFAAALTGNYEVVDYLLNQRAYRALKMQEKYVLLRDIVDAGIQSAQNHFQNGKTEKAIHILEKTFFYNKKIVDKEDDDYKVFSYALCILAAIHLKESRWEKVSEVLQEATFIQKKIIHKNDQNYSLMVFCFNALARHYAKERNLTEAIKVLLIAHNYCKMISSADKNKAKLLTILENNLLTLYQGVLVYEAQLWGFEDKRIKRNTENSLPYVILDQLNSQKSSLNNHFTLENFSALFAVHMEKFESSYAGDLGNKELHAYLTQLTQEGIWTMEHALAVLAFSRALNVNLVIIRYDGAAPIILKQAQPEATLYLGIGAWQVYQSLNFRSDWVPARSIQKQLDAALVDDFHKIHYEEGRDEVASVDFSAFEPEQKSEVTLKRRHKEMAAVSQSDDSETKKAKHVKIAQRKRVYSEAVGERSNEESLAKYTKFFTSLKPLTKDLQAEVLAKSFIRNGL